MAWAKVPAEHVVWLEQVMAAYPDAERRAMFGCPVFFIGGNMTIGAHEENVILRLSAADQEELLEHPAVTHFTPMPGRPMREYLCLPPALHQDDTFFAPWVARAVAYVRTLPPPAPKPKRARKSR